MSAQRSADVQRRAAVATTCPLTGRVGVWTPARELRPRRRPVRQELVTDVDRCPFCDTPADDERLIPGSVEFGAGRWFAMRNLYPPLAEATGAARLVVGPEHGPTLTHLHRDAVAAWTSVLALQQHLAGDVAGRWSLLTTAVGSSAGASQQHPHAQVLTPTRIPPMTVAVQHRLARPEVLDVLWAEEHRVLDADGLRLVAPPVPLGPDDLLLLPVAREPLAALDPAAVARTIVGWLRAVQELGATAGRPSPAAGSDAATSGPAPVDVKVLLHAELPDGTGRWWAELQVTEAHAPGVAAAPLVDVVHPPAEHAERFRGRC